MATKSKQKQYLLCSKNSYDIYTLDTLENLNYKIADILTYDTADNLVLYEAIPVKFKIHKKFELFS